MKRKHIYNLGIRQIQKLRKQIVLCSIYLADYINTYEIDENETCVFFDGFTDYLSELMQENETDYNGDKFFDLLPKYDNAENLKEYFYNYCCGATC